ncbi:MAG TPA: methylenetetrahydrofolate reductase [Solirubrobacteraceae bacterium]|nr:methylenetetrahydrofolate reductase [Solirubrobacteraceae bacterium]
MDTRIATCGLGPARFEVMPFARSLDEAARLPEKVRLTITCSPKHGPDRSVEMACKLREMGHQVTVHVAARMVSDRDHLDRILAAMAQAGADDLFLIGGDADPPLGAYSSAVELLDVVATHPQRPRTIGIAGYPEGHPAIADEALEQALAHKSRHADYVATQMCFDPDELVAWVRRQRARGMVLPTLIGIPGKVSRTKLLELSARIGVGPSLSFLRKQRGIRALVSKGSTADKLYAKLASAVDDPELNIAGFHIFTFNQLLETWQWQRAHDDTRSRTGPARPTAPPAPRPFAEPEQGPA